MAMAPEVFKFTREFGRGQQIQEKPSVIQQIAGTLGNVALAGAGIAGAYGLARALSPETEISPVSTSTTSDVGEPKEKFTYTKDYSGNKSGNYGNPVPDPTSDPNFYSEVVGHDFGSPTGDGFVEPTVRIPNRREEPASTPKKQRTTVLPEGNYGNKKIDPAIEAKYSIARNEAPLHLANRFEKMAYIGEDQANAAYEQAGLAALDQAFEDAVGRDDYHEERFGIQGSPQVSAIVEGPETVIQPANESKGFLNAFAQEVEDFDHNIPWGERTEQALESDSALGAAGIMAGTVAEKGLKDVGTRAKKIVTGVPESINKVKNIASDIGETVTREIINSSIIPDNQMQPSKWAEAARLAAGFPALEGSGGVEIGNESDLSDNAQADDLYQQNEQITPAGINRQTSGLEPDPVEGEMQTIAQAVDDLAASFGKGLAHLSPDERVDIARKMIEKDLRNDGYKGPINFG
jgi:hypothetical protein